MIFGTSLKDISPKLGVELAGYPHCPRPNKGVHDPLYAACLYINDGEKEFALVTFDLLYFGKKLTKQLRDKFGFEIMCTTTHTHSGPWASTVLASEEAEGIKCNEEYIEFLMATVESAIEEARTNTFEGEIGTGVGRCGKELGVGGNRRVKNGVQDDAVNVLSVRDKEGKVRCVLLNYALHPTYLHAENELCTADYPCYFRRFMHFAQPDAMAMFAQGCSGDQSSRYHRVAQDFEEAARVGTTLGVIVNQTLETIEYKDDVKLVIKHKEFEPEMRKYPTPEEAEQDVIAARQLFEDLKAKGDYIPMRNAELNLFGRENILVYAKLAQEGYRSGELPCEIMTVAIDDTFIAGIQGELFVDWDLAIKEASPYKKTFVFSVTNGAMPGYAYTHQAAVEGGYEVGTSMLTERHGQTVVDYIKEMF